MSKKMKPYFYHVCLMSILICSIFAALACNVEIPDEPQAPKTEWVMYQELATTGALHWKYFNIDENHFLVVANEYTDSKTYDTVSKIYKWNGFTFSEYQSLNTSGAFDWEYFTIDGRHYLVVANYYSTTAGSHDINSCLYKWDGKQFNVEQNIPTNGAMDWEYFTINGEHYLAVANYYSGAGGTYNTNSLIYKWNGRFIPLQSISTNGARDCEYFTINEEHYLVIANYYNPADSNKYNINSKIYKYQREGTKYTFKLVQEILTNGALDWEFFIIDNKPYLAVANSYNGTLRNIKSIIYTWNGQEFTYHQSLDTKGATAWKYFNINNTHYLAVANAYDDKEGYNTDSVIYKWDGAAFIYEQSVPTKDCYNIEYFSLQGKHFLAMANAYDGKAARYNIFSNIYFFQAQNSKE